MENNRTLSNAPLIKIKGVKKYFPLKKTKLFQKTVFTVKANDGIDLVIHKGETLGLVGESGCGKSTLGRLILQLYPQTDGKIIYYGYSIEEYAPRYLLKGVLKLKEFQQRYQHLANLIPQVEAEMVALENNPAEVQKRKELAEKVNQLKLENERIYDQSKRELGAFITSNDINAIKKFPHSDSVIFKNERQIKLRTFTIKELEVKLEQAKVFKNEKAEAEVAEIKKHLHDADLNVKADLNKKLAIAERKAKEHISVIDLQIRQLEKEIVLIKGEMEDHIKRIKSSLDKNIELNTEILTKLVAFKMKHFENEQLIKAYEDVINYKKQHNEIANIKAKIESIFDTSSYVTGAFILHQNIDEVTKVLGYNIEKKNALKVEQEKLNMLKIKLIKVQQKLDQNQEKNTDFENEFSNNQIQKLKNKIKISEETIASLQKSIASSNEQIEVLRDQIRDHKLFEKLESNRETGIDLSLLTSEEMRVLRKDLQLIFQDPYSSLNPRLTVGQIINEGMKAHNLDKLTVGDPQEEILKVMDKCGLAPYMVHRYPHQFSGGQRQRIGIARALGVSPKFIVCDEAVSALDVSIQSQIINLLEDLREQENLTYLFISHDLSVIKHISDRIGVMYLGKLVELGESEAMYNNPLHPYTKALISSIPTTEQGNKKRIILEGDIPSNVFPPSGCKFRTRCPIARKECAKSVPQFREVEPGRFVACHFYEETKNIRAN